MVTQLTSSSTLHRPRRSWSPGRGLVGTLSIIGADVIVVVMPDIPMEYGAPAGITAEFTSAPAAGTISGRGDVAGALPGDPGAPDCSHGGIGPDEIVLDSVDICWGLSPLSDASMLINLCAGCSRPRMRTPGSLTVAAPKLNHGTHISMNLGAYKLPTISRRGSGPR